MELFVWQSYLEALAEIGALLGSVFLVRIERTEPLNGQKKGMGLRNEGKVISHSQIAGQLLSWVENPVFSESPVLGPIH